MFDLQQQVGEYRGSTKSAVSPWIGPCQPCRAGNRALCVAVDGPFSRTKREGLGLPTREAREARARSLARSGGTEPFSSSWVGAGADGASGGNPRDRDCSCRSRSVRREAGQRPYLPAARCGHRSDSRDSDAATCTSGRSDRLTAIVQVWSSHRQTPSAPCPCCART